MTCARGSSAHAATFGKHLIERYLGIVAAAAAPGITTIYHQRLRLDGQFFLAISQSGKSGDIVEQAAAARACGAVTACVTNDPESPLAHTCEFVLPMAAGPELSIPATKTFVASAAALSRLVAFWAKDRALARALDRLPDRLAAAGELDWSGVLKRLADAESLVTIGRGPTLAIAREAALKLKETSDLHAEAFSAAEFLHGPVALVSPRFPVLMFAPTDAAAAGMVELAADLRAKGAAVFITSSEKFDAGPASGAAARACGNRRDLSDPELLRNGRAFGRKARQGRRPAASSAQDYAYAMSQSPRHAVAADVIFDGNVKHDHAAVVIEGARMTALTARAGLPASMKVFDAPPGAWLAPGFIDVQVNGGGDVLFNDDPTPATIVKIVEAHRRFGVTTLLPTLITDSDEKMTAALDAVGAIMTRQPGVLGVHLEGPFLSPEKPGVHRRDLIRPPQPHHRRMLDAFRAGVLLVTLAPEETPDGFIAELAAAGAKASLGHSMATYAQARAAMAEGLTGFTHLFNAMRPLSAREPGPVAAALESPDAFYGLIVDGVHVAPAMLRLALRGVGRPCS